MQISEVVGECRRRGQRRAGQARRHVAQHLGQRGQQVAVDARAAARTWRCCAAGHRLGEAQQAMSSDGGTGGCTASSGSSVMPTPAATIWRSVSRLVARKPLRSSAPGELAHRQRLVAQAVALLEQQHVLAGEHRRGRPGPSVAASGWSAGTASTKSSSNRSSCVQLVVVRRAGRARRRRARRRAAAGSTTSVFSSTSSSSRLREAVVQLRAPRGAAGTAPASGTGRCARVPASGSLAWRAMLADVVGLAEDDAGPLDDLLARPRSASRGAGLRSTSSTPSSSSSFLIWVDSVGWLTKQASAARPKWRWSARATRYRRSRRFIGAPPVDR